MSLYQANVLIGCCGSLPLLQTHPELVIYGCDLTANLEAAGRIPDYHPSVCIRPDILMLLLSEPLRWISGLEVYSISRLHRMWEMSYLDLLLVAIKLDEAKRIKGVRFVKEPGTLFGEYQQFILKCPTHDIPILLIRRRGSPARARTRSCFQTLSPHTSESSSMR